MNEIQLIQIHRVIQREGRKKRTWRMPVVSLLQMLYPG